MKLLQRLRIWRELKRLEMRARTSPSPTTFVDLGQVYINLGMHDQTLRVSEEGLALFPHSKELRKLNNFAKRFHLKGRVAELRRRLASEPNPQAYRELAGLYLEIGDHGAVHGTCEEGIRRFPDDAGIHLVLARARLANFYRDLRARDGLEAVRSLERVSELDSESTRAHKLLGELLYRVGAVGRALKHLHALLEVEPGDVEADGLLRRAEEAYRPGATFEDLDELFAVVESRGRLAFGPVGREPGEKRGVGSESSVSSIRDALARIADRPGVRKAAYIRGAKALIKGEIRGGKDPFLRLARVVAKAAQRTCRRIDLGNFSKGVVDGDFGHLCVCCYGEVIAAVLCDADTAVERILADLQELVARSLYRSEVASP